MPARLMNRLPATVQARVAPRFGLGRSFKANIAQGAGKVKKYAGERRYTDSKVKRKLSEILRQT